LSGGGGGGGGVVVCCGGEGQGIIVSCGEVVFSSKYFCFRVVVATANGSKLLPDIKIWRVTYGCKYLEVCSVHSGLLHPE